MSSSDSNYLPAIMPGAEPFFLPGNETGILLIHGFTGTPREMRFMGDYLNRMGFTCLGIRLAGHATKLEDLEHVKWQDWYGDVLNGIELLRSCTSRVFLAGLSMGGVLTLLAAARCQGISGAITMSTPFTLGKDWRLKFAPYIKRIIKTADKFGNDWLDKEMYSHHLEYPAFSTPGLVELMKMMKLTRESLPLIRIPVCLLHSKTDAGVPIENMVQIHGLIGSEWKEMVTIETGSHTMTCDSERQTVFEHAFRFIQKVISA